MLVRCDRWIHIITAPSAALFRTVWWRHITAHYLSQSLIYNREYYIIYRSVVSILHLSVHSRCSNSLMSVYQSVGKVILFRFLLLRWINTVICIVCFLYIFIIYLFTPAVASTSTARSLDSNLITWFGLYFAEVKVKPKAITSKARRHFRWVEINDVFTCCGKFVKTFHSSNISKDFVRLNRPFVELKHVKDVR